MTRSLGSTLKKVDIFGQRPQFHIMGNESIKSVLGALISLGIMCTVIPYAINNFYQMYRFEGTRFETKVIHEQTNNTLSFEDMEINLAFGIFDDNNQNVLNISMLEWDVNLLSFVG